MNLNTRFRLAGAAIVLVTALGVTATACSSSSTSSDGTIRPNTTRTGTFRACDYKPVEDGVKVDEDQKTPCVLIDVREADDRKKAKKSGTSKNRKIGSEATKKSGSKLGSSGSSGSKRR